MTLSGSTLYGVTGAGGANSIGNIFRINTNGGGLQSLFSFNGPNGEIPAGGLTLSGSTLYGMTSQGGANGDGTIFSINTNGTGFQDLYDITGANDGPDGSLIINGATLYGATWNGGSNGDGTVFALNIAPATVTLAKPAKCPNHHGRDGHARHDHQQFADLGL